ncbi:MAG TPA: response regulator [Noviherbaspirillum sp.]|jgi:DNA-binding NtrC family response regulator|uniref:response regulator n=1 Tax=Noviherbaspirillum sp. TaxID=1926288 RepID=UPI002DDD563D|nr:response regulator [Noviherbaspirillum sp.]HEV2612255.1 response regulator [Noviherbaspirillum sp.]
MHPHLLSVDDEIDMTSLFETYFVALGYRVSTAQDGNAALAIDETDPVDLLITDLAMPGMRGDQLAAHFHERRPDLPVIIVTGYAGSERFDNRRISLLAKPVSMALLGKRVSDMLSEAEST